MAKNHNPQAQVHFFITIHKYFTFGTHMCSFTFMTTYQFLVSHTYFFFLIYAHIFWNCKHLYKNKILMVIKCYAENLKYFTFVSHISSFTSMLPLVFHVWPSYLFFANANEVSTVIHKHFTLKLYTHVYILNTNANKVLTTLNILHLYTLVFLYIDKILMCMKCSGDSLKYFMFVSHICSFHVWSLMSCIFGYCKCLSSFYCNS